MAARGGRVKLHYRATRDVDRHLDRTSVLAYSYSRDYP